MRAAVAEAATLLVLACLATAAPGAGRSRPPAEKPMPSYVVPNIVAGGMCLTILATACKRFRR
ncbi:MAG: hypothetical protein AMK72_12320 [Planctomycetes bacterium SM23_25]|nr:MAG: hypothetical protein AMK72_12320 [Planctomycetes bacterium SM23_25]